DGADLRVGVQRMADLERLGTMSQFAYKLRVDAALNDDATAGGTALAGRVKSPLYRTVEGSVQVGVVQHDQRILAAHLQLNFLLARRGLLEYLAPGRHRAGKGNGFYARVFDKGRAHDRTAAHDQIENPLRQPAAADDFGQGPCRTWHQVGRLEHHAVSVSQCRRDFPGRNGNGKVPGRNDADDPDGFARYLYLNARPYRGHGVAFDAQRLAGEELEDLTGSGDFGNPFGQGLALFARQQRSQFVLAGQQLGADGVQCIEALLGRAERPGRPGAVS